MMTRLKMRIIMMRVMMVAVSLINILCPAYSLEDSGPDK